MAFFLVALALAFTPSVPHRASHREHPTPRSPTSALRAVKATMPPPGALLKALSNPIVTAVIASAFTLLGRELLSTFRASNGSAVWLKKQGIVTIAVFERGIEELNA